MSTAPSATVLAVGTEITTGQILNSNAQWLSQRLTDLGVTVVLHETVADDREDIEKALDRCASRCSFIFVTGGLGPTTDDFTREVIAKWAHTQLHFDEPTWNAITERLRSMGSPVGESQRRQCFFPVDATQFRNSAGTAKGFFVQRDSHFVYVLPGPPLEIQAIWFDELEPHLKLRLPGQMNRRILKRWQCLGKGEGALGEITEAALSGSGLQIGYRTHNPYVEIKVWFDADSALRLTPQSEIWAATLERTLSPWVITHDDRDLRALFFEKLGDLQISKVRIWDGESRGFLAERLAGFLQSLKADSPVHSLSIQWSLLGHSVETQVPADPLPGMPELLDLSMHPVDSLGQCEFRVSRQGNLKSAILKSPFEISSTPSNERMALRLRRYYSEMAWKIWRELLE